jgi:RimJ/RimL family protein N-acetyltransferase
MHLEPIRPEHADAVQRLARDPLVTATTTLPEPYPDGGAAWWIADVLPRQAAGQEHVFAMRVEDGEIAGVVGLADVQGPGGSAELGYWVGVPYWGRGYATAGCVMAVDFAFGWLSLAEVNAFPLRENGASRRVLEKAGFRLEGIIPNRYPKWSPERSLAHYRITRADIEPYDRAGLAT